MAPADGSPTHLFVYGTLRPGEVRWHFLEPFVVDEGVDTTVSGEVFDTGLDYPAAMFREPAGSQCGIAGSGFIRGRVYELVADRRAAALAALDEVEGAVRGLYHRVVVRTAAGHEAWAYQCGDESLLVRRLESGDWLDR
jgi:gamma-glutamylcyclotransferase (GGCT)/AIG2-like uncharacterized protein YtfP